MTKKWKRPGQFVKALKCGDYTAYVSGVQVSRHKTLEEAQAAAEEVAELIYERSHHGIFDYRDLVKEYKAEMSQVSRKIRDTPEIFSGE